VKALAIAAAFLLVGMPLVSSAAGGGATFAKVDCGGDRETDLVLSVGLDAEITLDPGEEIIDGIHADPAAWDPHAIYDYSVSNGVRVATPHLIFKPSMPGLEANVILTTTRRTYRFYLRSAVGTKRLYLSCRYPDRVIRKVAPAAIASPASIPEPSPSPTDEPTLDQICTDQNYPVKKMKRLGDANFVPSKVCSDGAHMYVQLYSKPPDTPALFIIGPGGDDQMANFSFDDRTLRYKLDGVYPSIVLVLGSGKGAQRVVIIHG
jgi:type IV secretion system protein VirB9